MKKYQVVISKVAAKELKTLPKETISRLFTKMQSLADDPRPTGCKKLEGYNENIWRVRVGDYRIIYAIDDAVYIVDVRHVGHRRDIYK